MKILMNRLASHVQRMAGKAKKAVLHGYLRLQQLKAESHLVLCQQSGEGFVDTALKILISVVIGALLLAGLYALFNNTVLPTLVQRVKDLFNYEG